MIDYTQFQNKKVVFHTLGCKLNFAETSAIAQQLINNGFTKVRPGEQADVCIVNTCSVTDTADRKGRQAIHRLVREYPNALMVVTGCYAQLKPNEIAQIKGVDIVLGANEKFDLPLFISQHEKLKTAEIHTTKINQVKVFQPTCSRDDRTRHFLKVQDGCDYYCTYCTIPFARGRSRSATVAQTVKIAEEAIEQGAKEIVLTGVNIGDFGSGSNESFFDLLRALDTINREVRFRISSIEPNLLTDEIIDYVANSHHIMPHFHIPLQSGTNEVLQLMRRKYNRELFTQKVERINKLMPDAFIGVDMIVGVRGETNELFEQSVQFIESLNISQLHVFTYSERAGTKMLEINYSVNLTERKRRSDILHKLSDKKLEAFYESQIGKEQVVLWESKRKGENMTGFTRNYIHIEKLFDKKSVNSLETIHLSKWNVDHSALTIKQ